MFPLKLIIMKTKQKSKLLVFFFKKKKMTMEAMGEPRKLQENES